MSQDKAIRGAKAGAAGAAGALFLGPTAGPVVAGFAADKAVGGQTRYTEAGIAIGFTSFLVGTMGGGSGGNGGVM